MPRSVNKVILVGHLGKDPEVKFTPSGMPVAKFSIATSDRHKDKDGNWQERTEWHNLVAFQRTAEIIGEYCKKGSQIYIEGKLQTSSWDDKETGQKKYKTEVLVNDLVLLGGRGGQGGGSSSSEGGSFNQSRQSGGNNMDQRAPEPEHASQITDDDIPF